MSNISKIKVGNTIYDIEDTVARASGGGLTADVKQALLTFLSKCALIDANGQTYYDALESALYPPANLSSISAVYTQSGTVYDTDSLNSLRSDLVVTAHYTDSSTEVVTNYTLSGTLHTGNSVITVTYGGKTATFNVTVTEGSLTTSAYITIANETLTNGYINDNGEVATLENNYFIDKFYDALPVAFGYNGAIISNTQSSSTRTAYYDASENFLSRDYSSNGSIIKEVSNANAVYEKIGWANKTADYAFLLNELDESLFVNDNVSIDANGDLSAQTDFHGTDLLSIDSRCDKYILSSSNRANTVKIAFYDSSQTFISRDYTTVDRVETKYGDIPSNAVYYRMSKHASHTSYNMLMKGI